MQKIRKILKAVSEKTALPTNQSTNQPIIITNNTDFIGPGWRRSKEHFKLRNKHVLIKFLFNKVLLYFIL